MPNATDYEFLTRCLAAGLCLIIAALLYRSYRRISRGKHPPVFPIDDSIDWLQDKSFDK